ncbi:ribonuclease H-like domain-containing protein [Tanacetum coccineum]
MVVERPTTTKVAWDFISTIVKDNKRSLTNALKAKLRYIKLDDLSMESYFQKIDSIVNVLTSLDSRVNHEYLVHYALEGLPDKYDQVCGYMHHKDVFPDLKTARSMLITEEMRLKSKSLSLPVDSSSSSPIVLMSDLSNSRQSYTPQATTQFKSWRPYFNFAKGTCRFGDGCKFVHDVNVKPNMHGTVEKKKDNTEDLLVKILGRLGLDNSPGNSSKTSHEKHSNPIVYYTSTNPGLCSYPIFQPTSHTSHVGPSPGFTYPITQPGLAQFPQQAQKPANYVIPAKTVPSAHSVGYSHVNQAQQAHTGSTKTILAHAFTAGTLHDPTTGAWNMNTGLYDASGASPM